MTATLTATTYSIQAWSILAAYIVAGLIGAIGNGFIIHTIYKHGMKTTTFALIANQAFSDMSCGLFYLSMWFFCSSKMLTFGVPGLLVCEIALTLKTSTFLVSIITMMAISIERYLKLYHPQNCLMKPFRTIIVIWFLSILCTVFCMFHFRASEFFTDYELIGCRVAYETDVPFFKAHYNYVITLTVGCFVPVSITAFMYCKVIMKIKGVNVGKAIPGKTDQTFSDSQVEAFEESKRQTTKMLILIVVVYFALCSPLFLIWFAHYFIVEILNEPCTHFIEEPLYYRLAYLSCVTSICINPFIYCYYNQIFKSEAKYLWNLVTRRVVVVQVLSCASGGNGAEDNFEGSTFNSIRINDGSFRSTTKTEYENVMVTSSSNSNGYANILNTNAYENFKPC